MNARFTSLIAVVMLVLALGCSSGEIPEPIGAVDAVYANSVRTSIDDIRTAESPAAAAEQAQYALENMEGFEEEDAAAEHLETYRQIYQGFEELRQMQSASAAEINAKLDEIETLTDQLPRMKAAAASSQ